MVFKGIFQPKLFSESMTPARGKGWPPDLGGGVTWCWTSPKPPPLGWLQPPSSQSTQKPSGKPFEDIRDGGKSRRSRFPEFGFNQKTSVEWSGQRAASGHLFFSRNPFFLSFAPILNRKNTFFYLLDRSHQRDRFGMLQDAQLWWHKSHTNGRTSAGIMVSKLPKERRSQMMEFFYSVCPFLGSWEEFMGLPASSGVIQKVPPGLRGSWMWSISLGMNPLAARGCSKG